MGSDGTTRPPSRIICGLLIWLAVGAAINMVVCWACCRNYNIALDLATGWTAASARLTAANKGLPVGPTPPLVPMKSVDVEPHWPWTVPPHWPKVPRRTLLHVGTGWRSYDARGWSNEEGSGTMLHAQYGLPWRGMCSWTTMWWPPYERTAHVDAIEEAYSLRVAVSFLRPIVDIGSLPLRPLWPGFALNTLFYATIAWGLWQVPLAIRRRRRRRLNRCVKCGYDRAGLASGAACPECGTSAG